MTEANDGDAAGEPDALLEQTNTFEDVVVRAERVTDSGPNVRDEAQSVLRDTVPFTRGKQYQILEALSEASGMESSTLRAMLHDEQCSFGVYGVLETPQALAAAWLQDFMNRPSGGTIVHAEGAFHVRYNDPHDEPFYKRVERSFIETNVMQAVPFHPLVLHANRRREIVDEIAKQCSTPGFFDEVMPGLQMRNGFLTFNLSTGEVEAYESSPEIRCRWVVSFDYDPDAECPVFTAGLERIMPDEQSRKSLLEKWAAAVFGLYLPGDNANSVSLVVGKPRSGKSTLIEVVRLLVPAEMCGAMQPADMGERFMPAALEGKRLNLVTELDPDRKLGGAVFKAMTSHETFTTRAIREKPRSIRVRAAHLLLANELPHIEDRTGAYLRRISAYRLDRALTPEEVDPNYLAKIAEEVPGIVNLLARSAGEALRRGRFTQPTEQDEMMAEMRRERDVVTQAIGTGVERKAGARLTNQELFDFVRAYAAAKGIDLGHVHLVSLGRRVAKAMREQHRVEPSPTKAHGGVPFYEGVSLKLPQSVEI